MKTHSIKRIHSLSILAASIGSFGLFSCGLFDDIATFSIETDWYAVSLDADRLGLTVPNANVIPEIPCNAANDICATSTQLISCSGQGYDCWVACGGTTCEVTGETTQSTDIDLSSRIKNQTSASALSTVSVEKLIYQVNNNTLNFDTPQIILFVGPKSATKVTDTGVVRLGTIAPITPATKTTAEVDVVMEEAGKQAMSKFVENYQTPFKILAQATMKFSSGSPLPAGRMDLKIKAKLKAKPI